MTTVFNNNSVVLENSNNYNRENLRIQDDYETSPDNLNMNVNVNIFRFKFTEDVMNELNVFAKIHQYDDRHTFKEAWVNWIELNADLVNKELCRLETLGYEGDPIDKMFKSARYYYRKKSTEKTEPKDRRQYVSVQHELLDGMDEHIRQSILTTPDFKPQNGFIDFCNIRRDLLKDSVAKLIEGGLTNPQEIQAKIKKTYKNRYFMMVKK
jgi:hypothetical protein